jgi:NitT/TauT family transport system permease protein
MNRHAIVGILAFLALWFVATQLHLIDQFFLPGPLEVLSKFWELLFTGTLNADILATVLRVAAAIAIAIAIGVPAGLLLGVEKRAYDSMEFIIDFFRSTPATAIFPLFLLVFGIDDTPKIAVAAFGAALIIIFNTAHGVANSKKERIIAAKLMGASRMQIFKKIIIYDSLPQTITGIRTAISIALVIIVVTEMFIGTPYGLGKRIIDFQYTYSIASLYATIILTGTIGYALNQGLAIFEKRFVHWSGK